MGLKTLAIIIHRHYTVYCNIGTLKPCIYCDLRYYMIGYYDDRLCITENHSVQL